MTTPEPELPAMQSPTPVAAPPAAARGGPWLGFVIVLALGVGLRVLLATTADDPAMPAAPAWETESLLLSLEAPDWPAMNGMRPAGLLGLHDRVAELSSIGSRDEARMLGFGLSLLSLVSMVFGAWFLSARLGFTRRRLLPLVGGVTLLWALHPSSLLAARAPSAEAWMAAAAPLALLGCAAAASRRPWLGALVLGLCLGVVLALGGMLWGAAVAAGGLAFLLPIPRPASALRVLLVAFVAGGVWAASEGVDGERVGLGPDAAWGYVALDWLAPDHARFQDMPWALEKRHAEVRHLALEAAQTRGTLSWLGELPGRVLRLGFSPARLQVLAQQAAALTEPELVTPIRRSLGVLDVLWRGGCLLFACTVLGLFRGVGESSAWPRVAMAVAVCSLALVCAALASSPLALLPFDVLLIATAGAGFAGAQENGGWTRRIAFVLGGLLLLSFCYVCGLEDASSNDELWHRGERFDQGPRLLALLEQPGESSLDDELWIGSLYLEDSTPFLRQPELAKAHAVEATHLDPESELTISLLVRAMAAHGDYKEAAGMALDAYEATGRFSKRLMVLLHWVQDEMRKNRAPAVR
ncbi:MAG: hypothetical protein DHS20C15_01510 [Planctomycetota bacterium]|nr:MAG: hypothetical protein DHS20C15_01510 [Planctomycetota bacterium]